MDDSVQHLPLLVGIFLAAGLVKGVTGMGLPTVAMGLLGTVMSPAAAAAILVMPALVTNLWQLLSGPPVAPLIGRLWSMMLCIVIGTVASAGLLVQVDPVWSGFGLGVALVVYASYALVAPAFAVPRRIEGWMSPAIGLITGVITGATGVFVMPAVPYLGSLDINREELVQALGLSFTVSTVALAIGLFSQNALPSMQIGTSLMAIVPALIGMWVGQRMRVRIGPRRFRQCFLLFLIALGLELASRPYL